MQTKDLAKGLTNPNAQLRQKAAQIIGLLDEVDVLPELAQAHQREADSNVKQAIVWSGQRLKAAKDADYSTLEELLRYFGIARAIDNMPSDIEARMMLQYGAMTMTDLVNLTKDLIEALNYQHPQAPSKEDIMPYVRALKSGERATRAEAMLALFNSKNTAALSYLVNVFLDDPELTLREQAQNTAKYIYWNAISWQMHQDGTMRELLQERARVAGKLPANDEAPPLTVAPADPDNIADILKKAEEARKKRRR